MSMSPRETILCRYRYDPLDRSIDWAPDRQASIQRFYCKSRLASEIQGAAKYSFLQHDEQVLAQQRQVGDKVDTTLLATDQQRSVLNALDTTQPYPRAYSPYGHHPFGNGLLSLLGFNGERPDAVTGHYHLGNGYRQFNPTLMRFNSPDSWSPFGKGGLNAYMYCGADPINRSDPTGHAFPWALAAIFAPYLSLRIGAALLVSGAAVTFGGLIDNNEEMVKIGVIVTGIGGGLAVGGALGYKAMSMSKGTPTPVSHPSITSTLPNVPPVMGLENWTLRNRPAPVNSLGHQEAAIALNNIPPQPHSSTLSNRSFELPTGPTTPQASSSPHAEKKKVHFADNSPSTTNTVVQEISRVRQ